jgi:hypothetical protein
MYGFLDLPDTKESRQWLYTGAGTNSTQEFQVWNKPPGVSFVYIVAVGAGGSGGCPTAFSSGVARNGGGGGGSGGMSTLLLSNWACPDTLYIFCGRGGTPVSTPATNGVQGNNTYVNYVPRFNSYYTLLLALGGGAGQTAGTGGAGGPVPAVTQLTQGQFGVRQTSAGQAGLNGNQNASLAVSQIYRISGGTPGAGNSAGNATGGGNAVNSILDYSMPRHGSLLAATSGGGGINNTQKFIFSGGLSPTARTVGTASGSGAGGLGSGGAGGSVAPTPGTSGAGGDGFVLIICG